MAFLLLVLSLICLRETISEDANQQWEIFLGQGKSYSNASEESNRKQIFLSNYNRIKAHNILYESGLVSHKLKVNKFADLTNDEFKALHNGFEECEPLDDIIKFVPPENAHIPYEFDWREHGAVTDVKDQKSCSSCWAFSAIAALEAHYFLKHGKLVQLSEQNLIDCVLDCNFGCTSGDMVRAFKYILNNNGVNSDESYPYEATEDECSYTVENNVTTIKSISMVESGNEEHLKAAVVTRGPIAISIDSTDEDFQFYDSGIYYYQTDESSDEEVKEYDLDHAVLVVGYGVEDGEDYWLIKNSWGTSWGEDGYMKLGRNRNNNCGVASISVFPIMY